ncbi:MAG: sulfurtransferase [Pseudomonadota bacterium]
MLAIQLPLILEPAELEQHLGAEWLRVVDLGARERYARQHIPGAVHLDYNQLVAARPPVTGLLPDAAQLSKALSSIGMIGQCHVVAYDDEGGAKAARLLWTLEVIGHPHYSLLNGGLRAWLAENRPISAIPPEVMPSGYRVQQRNGASADKAYILAHLHDPAVLLLDTRTPAEYSGADRRAARGGHIPGAVNMEWTQALADRATGRLKPEAELRALFDKLGVTPDKEIITYCQTHHRSSHTYVLLKALGYPRVRGYPGAWSEWGNDPEVPVE